VKTDFLLPYSRQPVTTALNFILILSFHLCLSHPSDLFPSRFSTKTVYMFLTSDRPATCPTSHKFIIFHFISPNEEESVCNFIQRLVARTWCCCLTNYSLWTSAKFMLRLSNSAPLFTLQSRQFISPSCHQSALYGVSNSDLSLTLI